MAAAVIPRSAMTANRPCRSVASGVVREEATRSSPTLISTVPTRPVLIPALRIPDSIR